jgi:thiamine transporter
LEKEEEEEKRRGKRKSNKTRLLARIAIISSLSFILSLIKIPFLSAGGSISFMMIPIVVISIVSGVKEGISAGFMVGILKVILDSQKFGIIQVILDYPLAFLVLGFSGLFKNIYIGIFFACFLRYLIHVLTGIIYFPVSVIGSFVYNASHMVPETIITLIMVRYMDKKGYLTKFRRLV